MSRWGMTVVALLVVALAGCKSLGMGGSTIPKWVQTYPGKDGTMISAVASSSATFRKEDGEKRAIENAMSQLAANIRTEVKRSTVSTIEGDRETFSSWTEANTTAAIEGGEVKATWFDEKGEAGDAGTWYAWVQTDLRTQPK